jgi:hypothetical protein
LRTISPQNCIKEEPEVVDLEKVMIKRLPKLQSPNDTNNLFDGFSYRKVTEMENSIGRPTSL